MWTIGQLGKQFRLSRSTLLYYDRLGLLKPTSRSGANYRLYSEADHRRLGRLCALRNAGLSLEKIRCLLEAPGGRRPEALEGRLSQINQEISRLRAQQRLLLELLGQDGALGGTRAMDKDRWVALLDGAGLDDEGKKRWHALFEREAPEAHQDFLEFLGVEPEEIQLIRVWSQDGRGEGPEPDSAVSF